MAVITELDPDHDISPPDTKEVADHDIDMGVGNWDHAALLVSDPDERSSHRHKLYCTTQRFDL
jgi:hypothetical protein